MVPENEARGLLKAKSWRAARLTVETLSQNKSENLNRAWWHIPVNPSTLEVEAGGLELQGYLQPHKEFKVSLGCVRSGLER